MSDQDDFRTFLKFSGIVAGAGIAIFLGVWLLAKPLIQPLVYALTQTSPLLVHYVFPGLVLLYALKAYGIYSGQNDRVNALITGIAVVGFLSLIPLAFASGYAADLHYADRTTDKMTVSTLGENDTEFPGVDSNNLRNVPLAKAQRDAVNNYQESRHRIGDDWDMTFVNGEPLWSVANVPDSGGERWSGNQAGATFVSQTDSGGQVYVIEDEVQQGIGVQFWRTNGWNVRNDNPWVAYDEPFMSISELPETTGTTTGEVKIVRPYTTHEYHYKWGIVPYSVESLSGAVLQDNQGNLEYLTVEEVLEHPELSDDNIYPYDLALRETRALNWQKGFVNNFWGKTGLFELADPSGFSNSLPYTVQGEDGSKDYYIPVTPQGGGDGLKAVFIADGQTGTFERYNVGDTRLVSSTVVGSYVEGDTPPGVTTWNEFNAVEPLPVTHNGDLYWQVRIVSTNGPGMPGYAFVNANQPDDIVFAMGSDKDDLARDFARGIDITDENGVTQEQDTIITGDGSTVTQVVISQGDTEVARFNVTGDTTIEFEQVLLESDTGDDSTDETGN